MSATTLSTYQKPALICTLLMNVFELLLGSFKIGKVDVFGLYTQGLFVQSFSKVDIKIAANVFQQVAVHIVQLKLRSLNITSMCVPHQKYLLYVLYL